MSSSLQPHGLKHARLPCPSPTPGACSNSCPSSWCHPTISSSKIKQKPLKGKKKNHTHKKTCSHSTVNSIKNWGNILPLFKTYDLIQQRGHSLYWLRVLAHSIVVILVLHFKYMSELYSCQLQPQAGYRYKSLANDENTQNQLAIWSQRLL